MIGLELLQFSPAALSLPRAMRRGICVCCNWGSDPLLAIEERFGFQFSNRELGKMTNIGRMIDLIANKNSNDAS